MAKYNFILSEQLYTYLQFIKSLFYQLIFINFVIFNTLVVFFLNNKKLKTTLTNSHILASLLAQYQAHPI